MSWLHDFYLKKILGVVYSLTEAQCADVFIKTFRELPKWQQAVRLIGIAKPDAPPYVPPEPGPRPETVEKKKAHGQTSKTMVCVLGKTRTYTAANSTYTGRPQQLQNASRVSQLFLLNF